MKIYERMGNGTFLVTEGQVKYIEFECLNKYKDSLIHCMSTRSGGISTGKYKSMNLGFSRNDLRDNVNENFALFCKTVGLNTDSLVMTNQVHGTKVCQVDEADVGKGFTRESDIIGVDGLCTSTPGVTLVTFHADCVPVFLYEPGINAAALLHSGWKGTLSNIAACGIDKLKQLPGFDADRLIVVLGPSIDFCCFEVSEDVYILFKEKYSNNEFYRYKGNAKWHINLKGIITRQLKDKGINVENINDCGICTKCRNDIFFSYRGDKGKTGSMAAFMQMKIQGASNEENF